MKVLSLFLVIVMLFSVVSCTVDQFEITSSSQTDTETQAETESENKTEKEIATETEAENETIDTESKEEAETNSEGEAALNTKSESNTDSESKTDTDLETKEKTESETDKDTPITKEDLGEPLKVMTYNLKNGSPSAERKENTINDIAAYMPDTIGTQETHLKWINALTGSPLLSDYELVGEQRYGDEEPRTANDNEASAILYRKSKFNLLDSGTYWLSETPEVVNSKLEGSKYVRIMTYVVLERKSDGVKFVHVNTHLNTTPALNLRQVEIMVSLVNEKVYSKFGKLPTYYTGDFNADPSSENQDGYKYLISTGTVNARDIAEITSNENTIKNGGMIDHCIVTKGDFLVTFFDVGDEKPDADTSNHFPVYAEMYIIPQNTQ